MNTSTIGLRVRLLRHAERDADGLPWAVEAGYPQGERKGYAEARILSRHATEMEASTALCELIRRPKEPTS